MIASETHPSIEWGVSAPGVETVPIDSENVARFTQEKLPSSELLVRLVGDTEWLQFDDGLPEQCAAREGDGRNCWRHR